MGFGSSPSDPHADHPSSIQGDLWNQETTSIILIDETPIREEAAKIHKEAARQLETLRKELNTFESRDQAAYSSWVHSTFADLIRQLSEAQSAVEEKQELIEAVNEEAALRDISHYAAYENVKTGKSRRDEIQKQMAEEHRRKMKEEEEREEHYEGEEREWWDRDEEYTFDYGAPSPKKSKLTGGQATSLKQTYRMLARKLHPDAAGPLDPKQANLWLEVQQAYDDEDLARLEAIWNAIRNEKEPPVTRIATIWELRLLASDLLKTVRSTFRQVQVARGDPAWGFSRPGFEKKAKSTQRRLKREFEILLKDTSETLIELESEIASWEREEKARLRRQKRTPLTGDSPLP